ncbi:MAG: hypothetical protein H5T45_03900 [Thermoplasmatales archaeon]|nr:hypothetical protein [Thermoplasmatales archaeon]
MIKEGKTEINIFEFEAYKGPGKKKPSFYNPTFEIDRDIEIIFCQFIANKGAKKFLDAFSSTGIRGIRIAKEVDGEIEVHLNEINPLSSDILKKNVTMNSVNVIIHSDDVKKLLLKYKYDYVNIDPYGSPAYFIFPLAHGLRKAGYFSITATDVATLCGVYRKSCIRRYGAIPMRGQAMKEIGMRILLAFIAKNLSVFDYSFSPILSYSYSHFFRIYGMAEKGAGRADKTMDKVGWAYWKDGWNFCNFEELPDKNFCGPLWIGEMHNSIFLDEIEKILNEKDLRKRREINQLLEIWKEEQNLPALFYETSHIAREIKAKQPKISEIINNLRLMGYKAGRTHFSKSAFKTDAPYGDIKSVFKAKPKN